MIKAFFIVVIMLFALLGLTEFIHGTAAHIYSEKGKNKTAYVVYLTEEKADEQLKYMVTQSVWMGEDFAERLVAVTDALSEETLCLIKDFAYKNDIILVPSCILSNVINAI